MNNFTFGGYEGGRPFAYYETLGGGIGAGPGSDGGDGMHAHMSNTRNTPVEALESSFPVLVEAYGLRSGSGGQGLYHGGEGVVRRVRFLAPVSITITSERRQRAPYGLQGGTPGKVGVNRVTRGGKENVLSGKVSLPLEAGDVVTIETPGGGGWGRKV